ncbi:hypothetical protein GYMLUDRAFT_240975 [Collybiopsis luxurians FD-317 M1]|nr:hypothetical protein GYMLUDRAFT_240975 [Collybiopsis luxurians FD-317 M1]
MVSTPQALLDALRPGYILMDADIGLIILDEAHHAVDNDSMRRRMIMGLTASPISGGNVDTAFWHCVPRQTPSELAEYVHRPMFKHIVYSAPSIAPLPFSTNLPTLEHMSNRLNIENYPYIQSLRNQPSRKAPGTPRVCASGLETVHREPTDELNLRHPSLGMLDVRIEPVGQMYASDKEAQEYTTRLFRSISVSKMKCDEVYDLVQWRWGPQGAKVLERYLRYNDA